MSYKLILPLLIVSGCQHYQKPVSIPPPQIVEIVKYEKIPVPGQCLVPCDEIHSVIVTNGDLLNAYNELKNINACWRARQECVIQSQLDNTEQE